MKVQQILIVEDEPLLCNAYELIFKQISGTSTYLRFHIKEVHTLEDAKISIKNAIQAKKGYDIVILDLRLTSTFGITGLYGEELGLYIRKSMGSSIILGD